MTALFLFAHQDDEFGVPHEIRASVTRGDRVVCAFLTNGAWAGVEPETRNAESTAALTSLGVSCEDIHFLGGELGIADGALVENLDRALAGLEVLVARLPSLDRIVMHAWEGGHQDHDATHLIGQALAIRLGIRAASRQFSLYRSGPRGRGLRFAEPIPEQGRIDVDPIPRRAGLRYLLMLRHYRSQRHVMLRLSLSLVRAYLFDARQLLQHLPAVGLLHERPAEWLVYERWGLYDYTRFAPRAAAFAALHFSGPREELRAVSG